MSSWTKPTVEDKKQQKKGNHENHGPRTERHELDGQEIELKQGTATAEIREENWARYGVIRRTGGSLNRFTFPTKRYLSSEKRSNLIKRILSPGGGNHFRKGEKAEGLNLLKDHTAN